MNFTSLLFGQALATGICHSSAKTLMLQEHSRSDVAKINFQDTYQASATPDTASAILLHLYWDTDIGYIMIIYSCINHTASAA